MKKYLIIFLYFLSLTAFGQKGLTKKVFKPSDYLSPNYKIKKSNLIFSKFTIELIRVKSESNSTNDPNTFDCRAWLRLKEKDQIVKEFYYPNMEPVGSCYGILIPKKQPLNNYFLVSKHSDYDIDIILINEQGKVQIIPGTYFYISPNKKYLISNFVPGSLGISVFDLESNTLIFSSEGNDPFGDWYYQDGNYFATINEQTVKNGQIEILSIDFKSKKIVKNKVKYNYPKIKNKLKIFDDGFKGGDSECNCP